MTSQLVFFFPDLKDTCSLGSAARVRGSTSGCAIDARGRVNVLTQLLI